MFGLDFALGSRDGPTIEDPFLLRLKYSSGRIGPSLGNVLVIMQRKQVASLFNTKQHIIDQEETNQNWKSH